MTRLSDLHNGINMAQGFPDFDPPQELQEAAIRAIQGGYNQYSITWGALPLRQAIAEKVKWYNGIEADPEQEITVTCGATEAMMAALIAVLNPGDEVIILEPFYENYEPGSIISGARAVFVPLHPPDFSFDREELRAAFGPHTKAIVINNPNNPTGKVFTREELEEIASLCQEFDVLAITDEIYEHILYDDRQHISLASLPGMWERTITINGLSKTYSVTGWRVGYVVAQATLSDAVRRVHDFLTVAAPSPFQEAGVTALRFPLTYYEELKAAYARKRQTMLSILQQAGFPFYPPQGAYYVLADISPFGFSDDFQFAHWLVKECGVAVVPGTSFYHHKELGRQLVRFAFPKREETLQEVGRRLAPLAQRRKSVSTG
ncbi:MAG: aminotransferase class I/II-fold pyridoxal phosphate-dependent enzyme [Nitrospinota bacterium]|nr:MAG: aminotransferase class I/II-fold pyridoxal phosphate-dependent enzyme [Nitrospinota bacterium]